MLHGGGKGWDGLSVWLLVPLYKHQAWGGGVGDGCLSSSLCWWKRPDALVMGTSQRGGSRPRPPVEPGAERCWGMQGSAVIG